MTCHLINKSVMKQNCIETLNQHVQPLEKTAAFSSFILNYYYYYYLAHQHKAAGMEIRLSNYY